MCAASSDPFDGLLIAVISGGRPAVKQRPVEKLLDQLPARVKPVTVISSHDAEGYRYARTEPVIYDRAWAIDYARDHWVHVKPAPEPGSTAMFGAFPGREWACREAEARGCWGVLQLDDNIDYLRFLSGGQAGVLTRDRLGGLPFWVEVLARIARGSNARMVGGQLEAVISREKPIIARPGFPYSMFIEKVGDGREPWYGPVEDDIQHALAYGTRAEDGTAAVVPLLRYHKETSSKTGMRKMYDHSRSAPLQRLRPEAASIQLMASKANGRGGPRVFHKMRTGAIRNPLLVRNRDEWETAREMLTRGVTVYAEAQKEALAAKLERRAKQGKK